MPTSGEQLRFAMPGSHIFAGRLPDSCNRGQRGTAAAARLQRNISGPAVKRIILLPWHLPSFAFYCSLNVEEEVDGVSGLVKVLVDFTPCGIHGGFKAPVICRRTTRWVILLCAVFFFYEHIGLLWCYALSGVVRSPKAQGNLFYKGIDESKCINKSRQIH